MGRITATHSHASALRAKRARLGLRRDQFAALLGVAPSNMEAWELGLRPNPRRISLLIELLTPDDGRQISPADRQLLRCRAAVTKRRTSLSAAEGDAAEQSAPSVVALSSFALGATGDAADHGLPPGGSTATGSSLASPAPDRSGQPARLDDRADRSPPPRILPPPEGATIGFGIDVNALVQAKRDLEASERALRQQLNELETLYRTAPIGLGVFDREMRCLRVNDVLATFNGYSVGDHLDRPLWDLLPESRDVLEPLFQRVFSEGKALSAEIRSTPPHDERDWFASYYPLFASDGSVEAVGVIVDDITERKRNEKALRQSEARFRSTFENAAVGIVHYDLDHRWLRLNQKLCQILGYRKEELRGLTIVDVTHPDDRAMDLMRREALIRGETTECEIEKRYIRKDGTQTWGLVTVSLQRDTDGRPEQVIAIIQDISQRKNVEFQLRESEEKFRRLVESAADAIFLIGKEGQFLDVNRCACESLGYRRDELLTMSLADVEMTFERERMSQMYQDISSGDVRRFPAWHRRKDGSTFPVEMHLGCYLSQDEKLLVAVAHDMTERTQMESALRASEERFHLFVDNFPAWAWIKDEDGSYLYLNRLYRGVVGLQTDEVVGKTDSELWAADIADMYRRGDLETLARNEVLRFTETCVAGGREIVLATEKFPFTDASGKRYVGGVAIDITERKRMEEALRQSEAQFHLFVDESPALTWIKSDDDRLIYLNKMCAEVLGLDQYASLGQYVHQILAPDMAKMFRQADLDALSYGHFIRLTETIKSAHGEDRTFSTFKFPFTDVAGNRYVGGVALDVTDMAELERLRESEELFRRMFDQSPVGAAMLSLDHRFLRVNTELSRITGYSEQELMLRDLRSITHPDDIARDLAAAARLRRGEIDTYSLEQRYLRKDGSVSWIHQNVRLMHNSRGEPLYFLPILTDITERKSFEEALFREKERAEVTLHSIGDGVITTDAAGIIDYLNPLAAALTAWPPEAACGQRLRTVFDTIDERVRQRVPAPTAACLAEGRSLSLPANTQLRDRNGHEYAIEGSLAPLRGRNGEVLGTVVVFRDVTHHRVLERKLEHDALHDPLTGVANRRAFEQRLARAVATAQEKQYEHAVCFVDLDQFKVVNDSAGHAAGDALLKHVPSLLVGRIRDRDTLARLGGDEFAILLEHCPLLEAAKIARRIVAAFEDWRFAWEGRPYQVGASVGVVAVTEDAIDVSEVLARADVACYAAKEAGRNRIHVYQTEGATSSSHHAQIRVAARLKEALEQERFRLFCQPIVPLAAGMLTQAPRYEILIRLRDEEGKLVPPGRFIPAAERYGLMSSIDRWVVRNAFLQYVGRFHPHAPADIAINVSGVALGREDFREFVLAQFAETGMPPEHVCFEITETAAIQNFDQALQFAQQIRSLGGKIALDDFGSGLSSFKYLRFLPTDFLKIDGAFVKNMLENGKDFAMVAAINGIGHELGLATVAEFVDKREIITKLRYLGVDYAQGYALGAPIPLEDAFALLDGSG